MSLIRDEMKAGWTRIDHNRQKNATLNLERIQEYFGFIDSYAGVTFLTWECPLTRLPHSKCIRMGSVRSSHLSFKIH